MPVTCSSVGDIISLYILVRDLIKCLGDARGSSAEYQSVIRELWNLDLILHQVELFFQSHERTDELNALRAIVCKCTAQCRQSITEYREKTKHFLNSLGPGGLSTLSRIPSKIKWQISEKDDLLKFRADINAQCLSLNMLLVTTGVYVLAYPQAQQSLKLTGAVNSPH